MKSNRLSMILALVLAVVTGALVLAYTLGADNRAMQGATGVEVYVTTQTLPVGQSLKEAVDANIVKLQKFPASTVPDNAIKVIDSTNESLVAITALPTGALVLASNFGGSGDIANGLQVPEGQIALTLNLEDAAHVGSFLTPGSEIALFNTFQTSTTGAVTEKTGVLISKVLVLAVGTSTSSTTGDNKSQALVTIAVSPKDSVRVVQAAQTGKVYFGILGANADASQTEIISPSNLFDK